MASWKRHGVFFPEVHRLYFQPEYEGILAVDNVELSNAFPTGYRLGPRACGLVRKRFAEHLGCKRPFHGSGHQRVHGAVHMRCN